jgi:hypothetical protein
MPWIGHERWQLVGVAVVQTASIGALSSLTINAKARTITFMLLAGAAATLGSPITFGVVSLGLDDQADM